jgi:hypothetical protein
VTRPLSPQIRVEVSSPPDRDFVVANIMVGSHEFAEVNQEKQILQVEVYPRQDGEPWRFDLVDLARALELTEKRLEGTRE